METLVQHQYHSEDWKPHWLRLKHLLIPAIAIQDLYSLKDIENGIASGQFQLWPGTKSIMITEVVRYPQKSIMNLLFCGGKMEELLDMLPEFERFATFVGCSRLYGGGRKGWRRFLKKYGFEEEHMIRKELEVNYE